MLDLDELKTKVKQIVLDRGAKIVGVGSRERLKDAPESGKMDYLLPNAQSCIIWAHDIPIEVLKKYLSKKERWSYRENLWHSYRDPWDIAIEIAKYIENNSKFKAKPVIPNAGYRSVGRRQKLLFRVGKLLIRAGLAKRTVTKVVAKALGSTQRPEFSLRYGGVAAGIGRLGWSGNLMTKDYGSAVYLGGVITSAPMEPDPLLEENPCNKCRMCWRACPTGLFENEEAEEPVIIAGRQEIYAKRNAYARCNLGCGGMAGLGAEKNWTTWTPDHDCLKEVPEEKITDEEWRRDYIWKIFYDKETSEMQRKWNKEILLDFIEAGILNNAGHPKRTLEHTHPTCGVCQAVCVADPKERRELFNLLKNGGMMFVDEDFREYIKRIDENGKEVIYYTPSFKEYEKTKT